MGKSKAKDKTESQKHPSITSKKSWQILFLNFVNFNYLLSLIAVRRTQQQKPYVEKTSLISIMTKFFSLSLFNYSTMLDLAQFGGSNCVYQFSKIVFQVCCCFRQNPTADTFHCHANDMFCPQAPENPRVRIGKIIDPQCFNNSL